MLSDHVRRLRPKRYKRPAAQQREVDHARLERELRNEARRYERDLLELAEK